MLQLTIVHDSEGNITSLVAHPVEAPPLHAEAKPTESVTQVDFPDLTEELDPQTIHERLTDLVENYRIDVDSRANLTRK
jgi:hypothetical protein